MKIMLFGSSGQVGSCAIEIFEKYGTVLSPSSGEVSFFEPEKVSNYLKEQKPDFIFNAAAYTQVDAAEENVDKAMLANGHSVAAIANYSAANEVPCIHFSTDYVYDGEKKSPYLETDVTNPKSVYGRSKLFGDEALLKSSAPAIIFRVSWVYSNHGKNFALTMKRLFRERKEIQVVNDQIGCPTFAPDIANACKKVVDNALQNGGLKDYFKVHRGVYHLSTGKSQSWFDFASSIWRGESELYPSEIVCEKIIPISSEAYPSKVARPKYSVLDASKARIDLGIELSH
jgi:dTDP-4-dehydrorhamnose reductase